MTGEAGCGKSTQIPQYLMDSVEIRTSCDGQSARVLVTQPRRAAAISVARRVAAERGEAVGASVGYHVSRSKVAPKEGRTPSSPRVYLIVGCR